jgi:PAS domain S-box-containing protein
MVCPQDEKLATLLCAAVCRLMTGERPKSGKRLSDLSAERRFELLLDAVTDYAIYLLDADGVVSSWNTGAQRFKGYTADEIIGQHFSRFYTEEDRAAGLPARALRIAAEEGRFEAEGWRVRKDGARFWTSVVIDPVYDSGDGGLIGFAKVTRDIGHKREAEEAWPTASACSACWWRVCATTPSTC